MIRRWSGLGYNRRALNLHRAATSIVDHHGGPCPRTTRNCGRCRAQCVPGAERSAPSGSATTSLRSTRTAYGSWPAPSPAARSPPASRLRPSATVSCHSRGGGSSTSRCRPRRDHLHAARPDCEGLSAQTPVHLAPGVCREADPPGGRARRRAAERVFRVRPAGPGRCSNNSRGDVRAGELPAACGWPERGPGGTDRRRIGGRGLRLLARDYESREPLSETIENRLIDAVLAVLGDAGACVISDYGKGTVSARLVAAVVAKSQEHKVPVLVDPKGHDYRKYSGVTLVTPNLKEAEMAAAHPIADDHDMILAAERILDTVACSALLITQGAAGMTLFRRSHPPLHSASLAHQVFDVTGAGDTVVAMLALGLAAGSRLKTPCCSPTSRLEL